MTLTLMLANMSHVRWNTTRPARGGEWEYALWTT
jgi:hypothetical protein